jgi:hypothetical protein
VSYDDEPDDVPRRFRRTTSCGPERTCGAEDCSSCYPNGAGDNATKTRREEDEERTSKDCFADVASALAEIKSTVLQQTKANISLILVGRATGMLRNGLDLLEEEREVAEQSAAVDNKIYHEWHRRMLAAEAELATLRHVHRPVVVSE